MRQSIARAAGFQFPGLYRANNVPKWQQIHQTHDGLRQWQKGPRGLWIMRVYWSMAAFTWGGTAWMMGRLVLGHKTWW